MDAAENSSANYVEIEDLPIRSNETSDAYALEFDGIGGYPLFAYLHVPKGDGPFVPLFQAPGYGSVVGVPAYERRTRYVVMALCHRGQRLSDSDFSAAYPGLLTQGLPSVNSYVWADFVADCLTAVKILRQQPNIDVSRLAITGGDLAWITAALTDGVHALQSGGFMFSDIDRRVAGNPDYPIAEFNDFKRSNPDSWNEALETLSNYDPMELAGHIDANNVMISCGAGDKEYTDRLAAKVPGSTSVRVNLGKGHLDHVAQEEWLAEACGVEPGPAHYPRP